MNLSSSLTVGCALVLSHMPVDYVTDGLMHLCTPHVQPLYEVSVKFGVPFFFSYCKFRCVKDFQRRIRFEVLTVKKINFSGTWEYQMLAIFLILRKITNLNIFFLIRFYNQVQPEILSNILTVWPPFSGRLIEWCLKSLLIL